MSRAQWKYITGWSSHLKLEDILSPMSEVPNNLQVKFHFKYKARHKRGLFSAEKVWWRAYVAAGGIAQYNRLLQSKGEKNQYFVAQDQQQRKNSVW